MISALKRVHDRVTDVGLEVSKLFLLTIVLFYCWEVFSRYFIGRSTWWADEYVPYLLCASTFLAVPAITRVKGHVAVSVGEGRTTPRIILAVSLIVCTVIAWVSLEENIRQVAQDVQLLRVSRTPKIYVSIWITYAFVSSALYFARHLGEPSQGDVTPLGGVT